MIDLEVGDIFEITENKDDNFCRYELYDKNQKRTNQYLYSKYLVAEVLLRTANSHSSFWSYKRVISININFPDNFLVFDDGWCTSKTKFPKKIGEIKLKLSGKSIELKDLKKEVFRKIANLTGSGSNIIEVKVKEIAGGSIND